MSNDAFGVERLRLTTRDLETLRKSYIPESVATAAQLFRVDSMVGAELVGRKARNGADYSGIVFVYTLPGEPNAREYRLRRDNPDLELQPDGTTKPKNKYLAPAGRGNLLYFAPETPVEWLSDTSISVTIVEGEKKTLAMSRYYRERNEKRLVIGISGVYNWKGTVGKVVNENGKRVDVKGPISDLGLIKWVGRVVLILFDSNVRTNQGVARARRDFQSVLRQRGASVGTIDLPEIDGCNGPDDILGLKGPEFLAGILSRGQFDHTIQEDDWEEPSPFVDSQPAEFPVHALPKVLRCHVEELSLETQTPVDLAAMLELTVAGAAVARVVRVKVRGNWTEPVNLYSVTALPPGSRKSPVFEKIAKPLELEEKLRRNESRPRIADATARLHILEKKYDAAVKKAAKGTEADARRAQDLAVELERARAELPVEPELLADDITPETLKSVLVRQGGRIALLSSEGDIFEIIAGRYSSGVPNLDVFLKGHSSDTLRVGRQNRKEYIDRPALSLGLTVQPDVIRGLADKPGFIGRGLCARILYSLPPNLVGGRQIGAKPMSDRTREDYERAIRTLFRLSYCRDADGNEEPHWLTLSREADIALRDFERRIEPELAEGGSLFGISEWAAKLAGNVVRLAGIMHLVDHAETLSDWKIEASTIAQAITIGEYLISHAKVAFDLMGADERVSAAKYVLKWLERHVRETGKDEFTQREAYRGTRSRFPTVPELEPVLSLLEQHGYIRQILVTGERRPGAKPRVFQISPLWINWSNWPNYSNPGDLANLANVSEGSKSENGADDVLSYAGSDDANT